MASSEKKPRSANFSASDCLVLAELMGEESGVEGLSFHAYLKHKFTNTITSTSKRGKWVEIAALFKMRADVPRDVPALQKKWDNLVQVHRALYMDVMSSKRMTAITSTSKRGKWVEIAALFKMRADVPRDVPALQKKWDNLVQVHRALYMDVMSSKRMTGGGPQTSRLTLLTEAVMDVVGRTAANTLGVADCSIDSGMLLLNQLYATTPSSSVSRETANQADSRMVEHIQTEEATTELINDLSRKPTTMLTSGDSSVQVVCCNCNCHSRLDVLKEEKLKLQIKLLKRKLSEE